MEIKTIIEISLQNIDAVKDAIKYNQENDNKCIIKDRNFNLISSDCVLCLINNGYKIKRNFQNDSLEFIYDKGE